MTEDVCFWKFPGADVRFWGVPGGTCSELFEEIRLPQEKFPDAVFFHGIPAASYGILF